MQKEIMTVHRALAELKTMDKRIETAIADGVYCIPNKHSNVKIKGVTVEEYKGVIQGHYDKVVDLIARRKAIKKAVVLSNAKTTVDIDGVTYTVAEAIEMKNQGILFEMQLYEKLKKQYLLAQAQIVKQNENLDEKAEQYVIGLCGANEGKTKSEEHDNTMKKYIEQHTYELVDPIHILDRMNELDEKITKFQADVDAVLSVSNAVTTIEIEY